MTELCPIEGRVPTLLYEKFTPVIPKKNHAKKLIVAEVISHYLRDTLEK